MNKKESNIVCALILNDFKYLSVRCLYYDWFFPTGAEVATQLLDNVIKLYLTSINREDLIKKIRTWKGNETHNIVKIIRLLIQELNLDFDINNHKGVLENIFNVYQARYLDSLEKIGKCKTILKDVHTIDYTYKYFRDKIQISHEAKNQTLINKLFFDGKDMLWGEDKISLFAIFKRNNQAFLGQKWDTQK